MVICQKLELKKKIQKLFDEAKAKWPGVFDEASQIQLSPSHLSIIIAGFQNIKLFNSNLQIIDEAFEYLVGKNAKGEKGQYFTPRVVIDMCVQMLNPQKKEYVVDTACGSAGFLVHTMQYVWKGLGTDEARKEYAGRYLFGIDFDEKSTKISRAIMLIAGDGKSHILNLNSLNPKEWQGDEPEKLCARAELQERLRCFDDYDKNRQNRDSFRYFDFDILLSNPPFAGEIKEGYFYINWRKFCFKNTHRAHFSMNIADGNLLSSAKQFFPIKIDTCKKVRDEIT